MGWYNYYGKFEPHWLMVLWRAVNDWLRKWALNRYRRFKGSHRKYMAWINTVERENPTLFVHWLWYGLPI